MNDAYLKLNAIHALYGLGGASLVRLTVDNQDENLSIQVLYQRGASEEEVERYRDFSTELFSIVGSESAQLDENLIPVETPAEAQFIRPLPVHIYCVYGAEFPTT